jgi:hypothetical protein
MTCANSFARRTAGLSAWGEGVWGFCADDVDAPRPDNNVSDKAKSNLFIAPLFFRIKNRFLSFLMATLVAKDYASGRHLFDGL